MEIPLTKKEIKSWRKIITRKKSETNKATKKQKQKQKTSTV